MNIYAIIIWLLTVIFHSLQYTVDEYALHFFSKTKREDILTCYDLSFARVKPDDYSKVLLQILWLQQVKLNDTINYLFNVYTLRKD